MGLAAAEGLGVSAEWIRRWERLWEDLVAQLRIGRERGVGTKKPGERLQPLRFKMAERTGRTTLESKCCGSPVVLCGFRNRELARLASNLDWR